MPRPLDFRRFSGASGSATSSGSKPSPSSRTRMTSSDGRSAGDAVNSTLTRLVSSLLLPCLIALATDSRTAMLIQCSASSSKPTMRDMWSLTTSTKSSMSNALPMSRRTVWLRESCGRAGDAPSRAVGITNSIRGAAAHCRSCARLIIVIAMTVARATQVRPARALRGTLRSAPRQVDFPPLRAAGRARRRRHDHRSTTRPAPTAPRPWPAWSPSASRCAEETRRGAPGADRWRRRPLQPAPRRRSTAATRRTTMRLLAGVLAGRAVRGAGSVGDASLSAVRCIASSPR